jgi:hypothetical protein
MNREDIENRYGHLLDNFNDDTRLQVLDMILAMPPQLIEKEILMIEKYANEIMDEYKQKLKVYSWLLGAMKTCPKRKI